MGRVFAILVFVVAASAQADSRSRACLADAQRLFEAMHPTPQRYTVKNGSWAYLEKGEKYQFVLSDGRHVDGYPSAAGKEGAIIVNPIDNSDPDATVSLDVLEDVVQILNSKDEAILQAGLIEVPQSIAAPGKQLQTGRVYRWYPVTGEAQLAVLVARDGDFLILRHGGKPWDVIETSKNSVYRIESSQIVKVEIIGDHANKALD
jgi:hypothetical protein